MTLQDFLTKVHDRNVDKNHVGIAFRDLMRHNHSSYENLNESDKEFIMSLIFKHRDKLFANIHFSQNELDSEYYRIWEKRTALGLKENDLKTIKEILHSFKAV